MRSIRVTVWCEDRADQGSEAARRVYPEGIGGALAGHFRGRPGLDVATATMDEPEHGLPDAVLAATDVIVWWGHRRHHELREDVVDRVQRRVLEGMGFVALHSSHFARPFLRLLGTSGRLRWREANEIERLWVVDPSHPIAAGVGPFFELREEMYGEFFDIPPPDELVFISWFEGGEVFRSGCTWRRGKGRIFYFRPGHETYPTYRNPDVLRVIENGIRWAGFAGNMAVPERPGRVPPLSPLHPPA